MKTKHVILLTALLFSIASIGKIKAQENLNSLMQKCETMDNVNVEVLYNKNPKTKKAEKNITTVTFTEKDNPKLLEDFLAAFKKDREAAYKIIEDKKNGKVSPSFYRFSSGTTDITYTLEYLKEKPMFNNFTKGDIRVSRIDRFDYNYDALGG